MEENVKKEITMDELALMVQKGFLGVEEKVEKEITKAKDELKSDISEIKADLNKKVDIFVHKSLEYRVEKLEEKAGVAEKK
jgi:hypothetical protein